MKFQTLCTAIIVLTLGGLATGAEKEKKTPDKDKEQGTVHGVIASVQQSAGFIQAELVPGLFTVRKGFKASNLKFSYHNPKTNTRENKLNGKNIFSVTEQRYMEELNGNPNFELPPGDYKFVVGGDPGATGTLTYTTVLSKGDDTTTKTHPPKGATKGSKTVTNVIENEIQNTVTALPGAGKKKVVVDFFEAQRPCKLDAWLTIDSNKMTLNFIVPDLQDEFSVTKATSRWEGTLEKKGKRATATGKTNFENITNSKSGKTARVWMKGTFTATLEGNVLTGSIEDSGQLEAAEGGGGPIHSKARWRIEGFSP